MPADYFEPIKGGTCVIYHRGTYRVAALFTRETFVYAKSGSGFVRLLQNSSRTSDGKSWSDPRCVVGHITQKQGNVTYTVTPTARLKSVKGAAR